jgi:cbb3-type cytochrome oxidase maturation protein
MSVIIILIIISVVVAVFFLGIFIWAVKTGQFDDTYSPSVRMLFDDKKPTNKTSRHAKSKEKKINKIKKK